MERCTKCRFLFEPPASPVTLDGQQGPEKIEDCPQCEGSTTVIQIESIEAEFDSALPPPTLKFATLREYPLGKP